MQLSLYDQHGLSFNTIKLKFIEIKLKRKYDTNSKNVDKHIEIHRST